MASRWAPRRHEFVFLFTGTPVLSGWVFRMNTSLTRSLKRRFGGKRTCFRKGTGPQAQLGGDALAGAGEHDAREGFSPRRAQLESVARASARHPDVFILRVTIDQKIRIRRALVLANARLHQRRAAERGKTPGQIAACGLQVSRVSDALAVGGVKYGDAKVVCQVVAAAVDRRDPVELRFILAPGGHGRRRGSHVPGRRAEIKDVLPRDHQAAAKRLWENLRQPGAAGGHEGGCLDLSASREA